MILLHLIRTLRAKEIVMCPFPRQDASQPVKLKLKLKGATVQSKQCENNSTDTTKIDNLIQIVF